MIYTQRQPTTDDKENEEIQKIGGQIDTLLNDITVAQKKFSEETNPIIQNIENYSEIPDINIQDEADKKELLSSEDKLDDDLDDAIIDLATKEEEI